MRRARWRSLGMGLGALVWAEAASADGGPKIDVGWYLPVGVPIGVALHDDGPPGFVLGAEVSLVHINRDLFWMGLYADAVRDFAADEFRLSVGPELGSEWYGIDTGYVLAPGPAGPRHGFAIRPLLTGALAAVYARFEHLFGDREESLLELGLLFKFPIPVSTRFRQLHPEPTSRGIMTDAPRPEVQALFSAQNGVDPMADAMRSHASRAARLFLLSLPSPSAVRKL